ncbi:DUF756 domain-containing protein [Serratia ureilytica]
MPASRGGVSRLRSAGSDVDPAPFTVEAGKRSATTGWRENEYHLWLLGPNGFHRELRGALSRPQPEGAFAPTAAACCCN